VLPPDRYSRQTRFTPFGAAGQARLQAARVAIVGCGALGTFQAAALARAGVGHLKLLDRDVVEWSNLQRQWLFDEDDAREERAKAGAAAAHLSKINSEVRVEALAVDVNAGNIEDLLEDVDLILDATDNFETRFLINDFAIERGVPWLYGAAVGSYGLAFPVLPGLGPCLKCVYPEAPTGTQPTCETAGVLNTITSLVAAWQVGLATKLIALGASALPLKLATFDSWEFQLRQVGISVDAACPCCQGRNFLSLDGRVRAPISLCGRNAVQIHERHAALDLAALEEQLQGLGEVRRNEFALRFTPDAKYELTIFPDGRAIIKGTQDVGVARSLYSRYLGR
jgi:molybdopterin/thiamine biosynthesis adenylyltransferase